MTKVMDSFQTSLKSDLPRVYSVADTPCLRFVIFAAVKPTDNPEQLTLDRLIIECSPTAIAVPKIRDKMALLGLRVNADGTSSPVEIPNVNVLGGSEFLELASRTDAAAPTYSVYINVLCKGSDEQIDTTRSQLDKKWRDFISQMESSATEIADIAKMESGRNQGFMGNRGMNGSAPSARKVQQIDNDIRLGV